VFSGTIVIDHNNPAASSANVEIDASQHLDRQRAA
jgi:polyisoprenoid-binding protein YceI